MSLSGVGTNCYIDHLPEWTDQYVDSTKRQLRLSAFAVLNKMLEAAVWTKVAVVNECYRTPPVNGFCPSPENAWGDFLWAHVRLLEEVLRFFHVSCKVLVDNLKPQSRIRTLANIDVVAAEAFWAAKDPKLKYPEKKTQEKLLSATQKYLEPLGLAGEDDAMNALSGIADWICFKKEPAVAEPEPVAAKEIIVSAPTVIVFDEKRGAQLNTQAEFRAPQGRARATTGTKTAMARVAQSRRRAFG